MSDLWSYRHEAAALGTAICWSITPLISSVAVQHLGALAFSRLRQVAVATMLAIFVFATGRWQGLEKPDLIVLLISGAIGIFAGDTLLFLCLNRLGPRRSSILFAVNAPLAAILGWIYLGEVLSPHAALGVCVTVAGVMLAIFFGKRSGPTHALESVNGKLWVGITLGLGAAFGQATGSIIARPIMASGVDPFVASMLRVAMAALCLSVLMATPLEIVKPRNALTRKAFIYTVGSGFLAMGVGMTLLLFALSGGKVGIVSTLSATSPVIILPLLWFTTRQRPAAGAWAGAVLVVIGLVLLFAGKT